MNHRVMLTGATGFLGGHVLAALLAAGDSVVVFKRSSSDVSALRAAHPELEFVDSDTAPLATLLAESAVDTIVHLACDQGRGSNDLAELLRTNVVLGVSLLQAARDTGVVRFLNADTQLEASVNAYARSKKQFAQWLPAFSGTLAIANMRLGNLYGPGESEAGFLTWLLGEFERGAPTIDFTPGKQRRDFVHVADVGHAVMAILAATNAPGLASFDVGAGELHSLRAFVELAHTVYREEAGGPPCMLNFGGLPYREGEVMNPTFDTTPLFSLGWRPDFSLEAGLRDTIRAYRRNF